MIKIENITLEQIYSALIFIGGLIGAVIVILKYLKSMKDTMLKPINQKLSNLDREHLEKMQKLELSTIKTDLVNFINDLEHDVPKSQIQKEHAHELYDRYRELGGNSYVQDHWSKLVKEGKV